MSSTPSTGVLNTNAAPFTTFTLAQVENMYSTILAAQRGHWIRIPEIEKAFRDLPESHGSILELRIARDRVRLARIVEVKLKREVDAWERQLRKRWIMKDNGQAGWNGI